MRRGFPDGADEDGDRRLRCDDGGVDVARRVDEAAGRAQRDDEERRALAASACAIARADVSGRDGMDDAVDLGGVDERRALASARCAARARTRRRARAPRAGPRTATHAECAHGRRPDWRACRSRLLTVRAV